MRPDDNKGISLTELIVATVAVGVIMVGVVSVDQAMRQSHQGTSRNALVSMKTSAIMLHITKNVQLTNGYRTESGSIDGIRTNIANTLCVRKEDPSNITPGNYSDDVWACYTLNGTNMNFCQSAAGGAAAACGAGTVLGTATSFTVQLSNDSDPVTGQFYVEITVINRFDPAAGKNTFDNPEITLTSRISPPGLSSSIGP